MHKSVYSIIGFFLHKTKPLTSASTWTFHYAVLRSTPVMQDVRCVKVNKQISALNYLRKAQSLYP